MKFWDGVGDRSQFLTLFLDISCFIQKIFTVEVAVELRSRQKSQK